MHALKRWLIYIFTILLLISIYQDLTTGTPMKSDVSSQPDSDKVERETITAIKTQVNNGDTVLSIVEDINKTGKQLDISQIMADFKALNPDTTPLHIQSGEQYYFPLYE